MATKKNFQLYQLVFVLDVGKICLELHGFGNILEKSQLSHGSLKKGVQDFHIVDNGLLEFCQSDYWPILMDTGYQGACDTLRAVHDIKCTLTLRFL